MYVCIQSKRARLIICAGCLLLWIHTFIALQLNVFTKRNTIFECRFALKFLRLFRALSILVSSPHESTHKPTDISIHVYHASDTLSAFTKLLCLWFRYHGIHIWNTYHIPMSQIFLCWLWHGMNAKKTKVTHNDNKIDWLKINMLFT